MYNFTKLTETFSEFTLIDVTPWRVDSKTEKKLVRGKSKNVRSSDDNF